MDGKEISDRKTLSDHFVQAIIHQIPVVMEINNRRQEHGIFLVYCSAGNKDGFIITSAFLEQERNQAVIDSKSVILTFRYEKYDIRFQAIFEKWQPVQGKDGLRFTFPDMATYVPVGDFNRIPVPEGVIIPLRIRKRNRPVVPGQLTDVEGEGAVCFVCKSQEEPFPDESPIGLDIFIKADNLEPTSVVGAVQNHIIIPISPFSDKMVDKYTVKLPLNSYSRAIFMDNFSRWITRKHKDFIIGKIQKLAQVKSVHTMLLEKITEAVEEIASTMFTTPVEPGQKLIKPKTSPFDPADADVSAFIALSDSLNGGIRIAATQEVALMLASALFGMPMETLDAEAKDAYAEIANMIAGGVQTRLMETLKGDIKLSPPMVVEKRAFSIAFQEGLELVQHHFTIEGKPFFVEGFFNLDPYAPYPLITYEK
jgi:chemotaxis protein CheX